MEWIETSRGAPYFETGAGRAWTPIGHNDAITWVSLKGCFRRKDPAAVDRYLAMVAAHGVTVLRIMLEYNHREHRYLEKPVGTFVPAMVRYWDDLLERCAKYGLRVLLTPFDTFWLWIRWKRHPYNVKNGGPAPAVRRFLLDPGIRTAIKNRLEFATARWGGSGVIFAWDLWNEIHPAMAEDRCEPLFEFIEDLSSFLRAAERRLHGRSHLQTVSIFGPLEEKYPEAVKTVLTHPALDFATTHFYEEGTIDYPRNTVDAAISTGKIMRSALETTPEGRPFLDSESGPIHSFKDKRLTLPEEFDDEYFRHMQWAHFASGGAGGGMRWPNRRVHVLTPGMHAAQRGLHRFLPLIDWSNFARRNWNHEVRVSSRASVAAFACGDERRSVIWLLRRDGLDSSGRVNRTETIHLDLCLPELTPGNYRATFWDTLDGVAFESRTVETGCLRKVAVRGDVAIAVTRDS